MRALLDIHEFIRCDFELVDPEAFQEEFAPAQDLTLAFRPFEIRTIRVSY